MLRFHGIDFISYFVYRKDLLIVSWQKRTIRTAIPLLICVVAIGVLSLSVGRNTFSLATVIETFQGGGDSQVQQIIWSVRFPRMILAFQIGAALALAGLTLQSLLKNPLVEPYLIGASSGAAFGAAIVLVLIPASIVTLAGRLDPRVSLSIAAFFGSLITIAFLYASSYKRGDFSTKRLILMGVVLGAFLSSFVALIMIASGENLRIVVWWLMGSLTIAPANGWKFLGIVLIAAWIFLFFRSYKLNLLSQGEETALSLGVNVKSLKIQMLVSAAVLTAAAVSMSGVIGFVGLIVPHFFRMIHGPDNRILIPLTGLGGGMLLMIADLIAHHAVIGELPIGVITTILGAPFFWYVLSTPAGER